MVEVYSSKQFKPYKYLVLLSMLYVTALLASIILAHKLIVIGGILGSAATFVFPVTYFCADIVAEVYGYDVSRRLIWSALFCELFLL